MKKIFFLFLASMVALPYVFSQPGSWRLIGKPGNWEHTTAGAVMGNKLYTIDFKGNLYVTDIKTGTKTLLGKTNFAITYFMFATTTCLLAIDEDGNLYSIDPKNGQWQLLGKPGAWKGTLAGAVMGDKLYTVEENGGLYVTDPKTGTWAQIGKPEFARTYFLFATATSLLSLEADGSLYSIDPKNGSWKRLGKQGDWKDTIVGEVIGDKLYTIEDRGFLYVTDTKNGSWKQIGKQDFMGTFFMFSCGESLLTIEEDGSLYLIEVN